MFYAFKALLRINLTLNVLTTVNNKDPEKREKNKKHVYPGSPIGIIPQDNQIIVWFLFTGIQLDCLFFMRHHQHCVVGWETKFHSIPSLSDSGVVLVREALTQLLEGGNGVDAVFRKSRGADAAPPGPRLQASGSPLW